MWTGMRMVRAWSAMARVMAWRIHHVAWSKTCSRAVLELVDSLHQADVALLDEVQELEAAVRENPLVRAAAASALRSVPVARGRGLIMAVLEASLQDEDSEVRKEVSESLRCLSR
jgi:hypothetical protein